MWFYIIIVKKTPLFDDIFDIYWESKMHAKILFIFMNGYTIFHILFIILQDLRMSILCCPWITISLFIMNYVSTVIISKSNINKNNSKSSSDSDLKELQLTPHSSASTITLEQVIQKEESFNLFMVHLSKE